MRNRGVSKMGAGIGLLSRAEGSMSVFVDAIVDQVGVVESQQLHVGEKVSYTCMRFHQHNFELSRLIR